MSGMKIVHITAGAGGRICGTCLHDNALIRSLRGRGCDAILVPAFVPTTTDEENVAEQTVVMGGVNVWLQEHVPLFRHTPTFLDAPLDSRALLEWLSSRTGGARATDLGPLTVSTLEGEHGRQRKEVAKLARWLAGDARPDVVHLSNVLLLGLARSIRDATGARIVCSRTEMKKGWFDRYLDQLTLLPVGSVAYKFGLVAAGIAEATFTPQPRHEWDVCGGVAVVLAAGGQVSDRHGRPYRFNLPKPLVDGTCATNGVVHGDILGLMRAGVGAGA